jgi:hypothetical protein
MYPDGAASFPLPWEAAAIVARAVFYAVSSADETALALHAAQDACAAVQTTAAPADIEAGRAERRWQQVHLPEPARRLRWLTERLY